MVRQVISHLAVLAVLAGWYYRYGSGWVNSTIYGLDWVHKKNGCTRPSEHSVIQQAVEAATRILAKPKSRKAPLTAMHVKSIVRRLERGSIADLQVHVAAMIALGYYGSFDGMI